MNSKRKNFLGHYFKIFGMEKIEWIEESAKSIRGTIIYDTSNFDEQQEFVWHKSENDVPTIRIIVLIKKLISEKLLDGDKLTKPTEEIEFAEFDNFTKEKLFEELFDVIINMVDNGIETDFFYIHD